MAVEWTLTLYAIPHGEGLVTKLGQFVVNDPKKTVGVGSILSWEGKTRRVLALFPGGIAVVGFPWHQPVKAPKEE